MRPADMSEVDLLLAMLQQHRDAIIASVDGLDEDTARRRLVPSLTTLIGIVNHLAGVERWWFRVNFAGEKDVPLTWTRDDTDADWKAEGVTLEDAIEDYRAAASESDDVARGKEPGALAVRMGRGGFQPTLRWVLVHMIEETAQHVGHADILRELLDAESA